jgi:hypothetical protein
MPAKQTRKLIEAELNANEVERIKIQFLEVLRDFEEVEKELGELEAARGLPEICQSKPLPERMAALGMRQDAIDRIQSYLSILEKLNAGGRIDELRADVRRKLAAHADVELTCAELLAGIVESRRKA